MSSGLASLDAPLASASQRAVWDAQMLMSRGAARYRTLNQAYPFAIGFALCFVKGVLADCFAQKVVENRENVDRPRVLAMALFSGTFCGCCYHAIFNVAFPRVFGVVKSWRVVTAQIASDGILVFPFLYMPVFYAINDGVRIGTLAWVPTRWSEDIASSMREYVKVWPATMLCVFTVIPVELRVSFIAGVSFAWLVVLSVMAN